MASGSDFLNSLEKFVIEQLHSQNVCYLLGAGSSYLDGSGYPLSAKLWQEIKGELPEETRDAIESKFAQGAIGLEHALDLLDEGTAEDPPFRTQVTAAIAKCFAPINPQLESHREFVRRISQRAESHKKIFSLNYDPLIERAAAQEQVRLVDGFHGSDRSYFDPTAFSEHLLKIHNTHRGRTPRESVRPIHLIKLHGSLGWYEDSNRRVWRCSYDIDVPQDATRLMVPPQRRKAADTMRPPYSALWEEFRSCLSPDGTRVNRLVSIGYGFADEHVNAVIEHAVRGINFTLIICSRSLSDAAWDRWSKRPNIAIISKERCSLKGDTAKVFSDLWSFERLAREV